MKKWHYILAVLSFILAGLFIISPTVLAQYTSTNYSINEVFVGSGSALQATSNSYQAQVSIGELGVGNSKGSAYQAQNGFNTTDTPELAVNVVGGVFDLGYLSTSAVSYASTTFTVENYLSTGYIVMLSGGSPTDGPGGHPLNPRTTPTYSFPGTEQFGVNLTANTSPSIGAVPLQLPAGSPPFSFGAVEPNYNYQNEFMFVPGTNIAYSNSSSGETQYTMSIIENISSLTPAGMYGNISNTAGYVDVVAVPTF
jgi:hypothetical protein